MSESGFDLGAVSLPTDFLASGRFCEFLLKARYVVLVTGTEANGPQVCEGLCVSGGDPLCVRYCCSPQSFELLQPVVLLPGASLHCPPPSFGVWVLSEREPTAMTLESCKRGGRTWGSLQSSEQT